MSVPKPSLQWFDAVQSLQHSGDAYALVTVLGCTGSTPRDYSSKMVITQEGTFDTIGGGHLEFLVMQKAREIITANAGTPKVEQEVHHFPLGASLGQCCGGSVTVLFESFVMQGLNITVFGAGHVAKALMNILGAMPGQVRWVDNRMNMFPQEVPGNVQNMYLESPVELIETLPVNSQVLILTHDHQLDFDLVQAALKRDDLSFVGCIGSNTKAERFQMRLKHRGMADELIENFICPVGNREGPGKLPIEVAVSMAAQLIQHLHANDEKVLRQGVSWKQIKNDLSKDRLDHQITIID